MPSTPTSENGFVSKTTAAELTMEEDDKKDGTATDDDLRLRQLVEKSVEDTDPRKKMNKKVKTDLGNTVFELIDSMYRGDVQQLLQGDSEEEEWFIECLKDVIREKRIRVGLGYASSLVYHIKEQCGVTICAR